MKSIVEGEGHSINLFDALVDFQTNNMNVLEDPKVEAFTVHLNKLSKAGIRTKPYLTVGCMDENGERFSVFICKRATGPLCITGKTAVYSVDNVHMYNVETTLKGSDYLFLFNRNIAA